MTATAETAPGLYDHIARIKPDALGTDEVKWNFTKFLVGKDGEVLARFGPQTTPDAPEVTAFAPLLRDAGLLPQFAGCGDGRGLAALQEPGKGRYAGRYEVDGRPNRAVTANTNAVVLESLAYIARGPVLALLPTLPRNPSK